MAITKSYTREMHDAGRMDKIQSLTAASTGVTITNYGVTIISSTQAKTYALAAPAPGVRKAILGSGGSTAGDLTIDGVGATKIAGSSQISFANATASAVELIGVTSTSWAIVSNTGGTLA